MEAHTLITIVITAVVTATAKLVVSWAFDKLKTSQLIKALSTTTKRWLVKESFSVLFDMAALSIIAYLALRFFWSDSPATKFDVLTAIGLVLGIIGFGFSLIVDLIRLIARQLRDDRERAATLVSTAPPKAEGTT